jgi:L-lactate permease
MNGVAVLLALAPVIVIFLLLALRRAPADVAGVVGWIVARIDRIGEEAQVIRTTFAISLVITAVCARMTMVWAF